MLLHGYKYCLDKAITTCYKIYRCDMVEEFKDIIGGLAQRISLYKSKLNDYQKKRDKIEDEIKTVKKYLEIAETLYRVEVEKAKSVTAHLSGDEGDDTKEHRESSDIILIEKTRFSGLSVPQAAFLLLKEAGKQLHAKEIYQKLIEGGVPIRSKTPVTSVAISLSRDKRYKKVAPNTYKLTEEVSEQEDQTKVAILDEH